MSTFKENKDKYYSYLKKIWVLLPIGVAIGFYGCKIHNDSVQLLGFITFADFVLIFLFLTFRFLRCPKCNKIPTGFVAAHFSVILNALECPFCKEPFE